jgi:uncharacterized cupredoxin-like copper-binding protein
MRVLAVAVLVGLIAVGCAPRAQQVAPVQEIEVGMTEFRFAPATIEVSRGRVKFKMKNTGVVEHNFVIPELGLRSPNIGAGQGEELEWYIRAQPGRYRIVCDIPGHTEAGMVGTLVVKERPRQ